LASAVDEAARNPHHPLRGHVSDRHGRGRRVEPLAYCFPDSLGDIRARLVSIDEHAAPRFAQYEGAEGLPALIVEFRSFRHDAIRLALASPLLGAGDPDINRHVEHESQVRFEIAQGDALEPSNKL